MLRRVRLTLLIETSDHDGYCSGDECEYTQTKVRVLVPVPDEFQDSAVGTQLECWLDYWDSYREDYQTQTPVNAGYSHYCLNSKESVAHDLERHECRVRVGEAVIVDGNLDYDLDAADIDYVYEKNI